MWNGWLASLVSVRLSRAAWLFECAFIRNAFRLEINQLYIRK